MAETLPEFLLRCIEEDEAFAQGTWDGQFALDDDYPADQQILRLTRIVLADCEAKRRIVELHHRETWHQPASTLIDRDTGRPFTEEGDHLGGCTICGGDDPEAPFPCDTLRALAPPFADRPGYREEWKP